MHTTTREEVSEYIEKWFYLFYLGGRAYFPVGMDKRAGQIIHYSVFDLNYEKYSGLL